MNAIRSHELNSAWLPGDAAGVKCLLEIRSPNNAPTLFPEIINSIFAIDWNDSYFTYKLTYLKRLVEISRRNDCIFHEATSARASLVMFFADSRTTNQCRSQRARASWAQAQIHARSWHHILICTNAQTRRIVIWCTHALCARKCMRETPFQPVSGSRT